MKGSGEVCVGPSHRSKYKKTYTAVRALSGRIQRVAHLALAVFRCFGGFHDVGVDRFAAAFLLTQGFRRDIPSSSPRKPPNEDRSASGSLVLRTCFDVDLAFSGEAEPE